MTESPPFPPVSETDRSKVKKAKVTVAGIIGVLAFFVSLIVAGSNVLQTYIYKQQLELSRNQDRRQNRAYVGVSDIAITAFNKPNYTIKITSQNFGQSLASVVDFAVLFDVKTYSRDDIYQLRQPDDWKLDEGDLLYQGRSIWWTRDTNLNAGEADALSRTDSVLVVHGKIKYKDIFSDERDTPFCYVFSHDDVLAVMGKLKPSEWPVAYTCNNGNESD